MHTTHHEASVTCGLAVRVAYALCDMHDACALQPASSGRACAPARSACVGASHMHTSQYSVPARSHTGCSTHTHSSTCCGARSKGSVVVSQPRGTGWRSVSVCHGAPRPWPVSDWLAIGTLAVRQCLQNFEITQKKHRVPDSSYIAIYVIGVHGCHSGFVWVPSNGTEIAASGCEIARDLCDRMCLNIFK